MANSNDPRASEEQRMAWKYYGEPTSTVGGSAISTSGSISARVGEVRYVVGWMADQIVRMGWRITSNGSEDWSLVGPDGNLVRSDANEADLDSPNHPVRASATLLAQIGWRSSVVRQVTTNLFVAGELFYINNADTWQVVSVIHPNRKDLLSPTSSRIVVRGLWPHPANPDAPDAPLFGVLDILDDMAWLSRLSRSQSANRVGMRGIIGVSDQMTTATGAGGEQFWSDFEASLSRPMEDPTDVSPVGVRGPTELTKPEGNGMGGLSWVIPEFPYDDKIDSRMEKLVQRLAYGLPIPPEILLGMQAQSKATAFQVEGATYRAHIEPAALLVAQVATDTLRKLLETEATISVIPDPTQILARRHSVQDVLEAFDRGAVGFDYLREVLGIPERARPDGEDIALMQALKSSSGVAEGVRDPGNVAAEEPIAAAARLPETLTEDTTEPSPESADDAYLSETLAHIDEHVLAELTGASEQAVSRVREKLGANVRSLPKNLTSRIPKDLTNEEIVVQMGRETLEALGVDVDRIIQSGLISIRNWWSKKLVSTRMEAGRILAEGGVEPNYTEQGFTQSENLLVQSLTAAVFDQAGVDPANLRAVTEAGGR